MFNLSKIFGKETVSSPEHNEVSPIPIKVEGKEPFDSELLTFNFTDQEIAEFKNEDKSDQEIELLRKAVLNRLERARLDDSK